ncbi:MAG: NAD(+)/NADH kinase [Oscillospiraceae bacterium]
MKIYIFPNLDKQNCREYTEQTCKVLNGYDTELFMNEKYYKDFSRIESINFISESELLEQCDVIVVIGGDGTILKCANFAAAFNKPILGINCGRLGFMASLEHNELDKLSKLCRKEYTVSRRMMLSVTVEPKDDEILKFTALNDVVISRCDDCKIADFEVSKNNSTIASLRADGVIFSTPTGATAYSMSAGGPIIEPDMECIEFTQICAHTLFARSMVLSPNSIIKIKSNTGLDAHTCVNVDGNIVYRLSNGDVVKVEKSRRYIDIIDINGDSFFTSVNKKLMQPLKEISED